MNSTSNRHIVQIFNERQDQLQATIFAFSNERPRPADDTVLTYWETPVGPALRAWFFPGDTIGQEFAYPKATAERIALANNNAKVPTHRIRGRRPVDGRACQEHTGSCGDLRSHAIARSGAVFKCFFEYGVSTESAHPESSTARWRRS